jgi:hypothetical protein
MADGNWFLRLSASFIPTIEDLAGNMGDLLRNQRLHHEASDDMASPRVVLCSSAAAKPKNDQGRGQQEIGRQGQRDRQRGQEAEIENISHG